jgi:hypothetical protein
MRNKNAEMHLENKAAENGFCQKDSVSGKMHP